MKLVHYSYNCNKITQGGLDYASKTTKKYEIGFKIRNTPIKFWQTILKSVFQVFLVFS